MADNEPVEPSPAEPSTSQSLETNDVEQQVVNDSEVDSKVDSKTDIKNSLAAFDIESWGDEKKLKILAQTCARLQAELRRTTEHAMVLGRDRKMLSDEVVHLRNANTTMTDELEQICSLLENNNLALLPDNNTNNNSHNNNSSNDGNTLEMKIVVAGASSVGKSSLVHYFVHGESCIDKAPTHGARREKINWNWSLKNKPITINLWDTTGQHSQMRAITPCCKGMDAIVLVFDLNDPSTLSDLPRRFEGLIEASRVDNPVIFLLGNKCDSIEDSDYVKIMSEEDHAKERKNQELLQNTLSSIRQIARQYSNYDDHDNNDNGNDNDNNNDNDDNNNTTDNNDGIFLSYHEVSAKTGTNCREVAEQIQLQVLYRKSFSVHNNNENYKTIRIDANNVTHGDKKKSKCCA